jgi:hypothetical protein
MDGYVTVHPLTARLSQKQEPYAAGRQCVHPVLPRHAPQPLVGDSDNNSGEDEKEGSSARPCGIGWSRQSRVKSWQVRQDSPCLPTGRK